MLNAIGLQNPGVDAVMSHELEELRKCYNDKVIAGAVHFPEPQVNHLKAWYDIVL